MLHIKRLAMDFAEGVDEISNINLLRGTRSAPSRTSTRESEKWYRCVIVGLRPVSLRILAEPILQW